MCEEGYDNSKARHLDDDDEEDSNDEDYLGDEEDAEGIEQMQCTLNIMIHILRLM